MSSALKVSAVYGIDVSPLVALAAFAMASFVVLGFLTDRLRLAVDFAVHRPDRFRQVLTPPPVLAAAPRGLLPVAS